MGTPYGFHVLVDGLDANELSEFTNQYVIPGQPNWLNVTGGARFNEAKSYVELVRTVAPQVNLILRQSGFSSGNLAFRDDGVWKTMRPSDWVELWVKPHLAWLQKWKPIYMVDNESVESGQALEDYANWMATAIQLCASLSVKLAVGRFPAGNPQFGEYQRLLPMFRALAQYGGIWSPNEYFGQTDELSNSLVGRFEEGLKVCDSNGVKRPRVVIGEYAVAYAIKANVNGHTEIQLDPQKGFSHPLVNWSYEQLMEKLHGNFKAWMAPRGAEGACIFAVGRQAPYETFALGKGFYPVALRYADAVVPVPPPSNPPPTVPPTVPVVDGAIPINDSRWLGVVVKPTGGAVNIRTTPSTAGNKPIGQLTEQTQAWLAIDPAWVGWAQIRIGDLWGWISTAYISWLPVDETVTITLPAAMYSKLLDLLDATSEQTASMAEVLKQVKS